jgi:hypothetical protein
VANQLDQDPLYIDTNATDIPCQRIVGVVTTGQCTITDSETNHIIFTSGTTVDGWFGFNVTIPSGLIDVAVLAGAEVMIYLGSGPR